MFDDVFSWFRRINKQNNSTSESLRELHHHVNDVRDDVLEKVGGGSSGI